MKPKPIHDDVKKYDFTRKCLEKPDMSNEDIDRFYAAIAEIKLDFSHFNDK